MGRLPRSLIAFVALCGAAISNAYAALASCPSGQFPEFKSDSHASCSAWVGSYEAVKACHTARYASLYPGQCVEFISVNYNWATTKYRETWRRRLTCSSPLSGASQLNPTITWRCTVGTPPPPSDCSSLDGVPVGGGRNNAPVAYNGTSGVACFQRPNDAANGCFAKLSGVGIETGADGQLGGSGYISGGAWTYTTDTCTNDPQAPSPANETRCESVNGSNVCTTPDPSCITVDGEQSCYTTSGGMCTTSECVKLATEKITGSSGYEVTTDDAATPPAPDTGTAGDRAPSDVTVTGQGTQGGFTVVESFHVFGSGTAGGSTTNAPRIPGDTDNDKVCEPGEPCDDPGLGDDDQDGTCEEGEACDDNAPEPPEDPQGCQEGEDCSASFGDLGDVPTFGESLSAFRTRIGSAPIAGALSDLSAPISTGGTCPIASFEVLEQSFTFDAHCDLLEQFGAQIRLIFIALFALAALLLFFKA